MNHVHLQSLVESRIADAQVWLDTQRRAAAFNLLCRRLKQSLPVISSPMFWFIALFGRILEGLWQL